MYEELLTQTSKETEESFSYDGYQVVRGEFFAHLFEPSVTLKDEKVSVNAACLRKLPDVEYVQFLVNPEEKKLAVKPCTEDTKDSFCWASIGADGKRKPKTISCKIFYAKVMRLMEWNPNHKHKILGKLIKTATDTIFVFDLNSAETFIKKNDNGEDTSRKAIYPENWQNQFGLPVKEHSDTVLVNIFDNYTVFRIEKNEGENSNENTDVPGSKEETNQTT